MTLTNKLTNGFMFYGTEQIDSGNVEYNPNQMKVQVPNNGSASMPTGAILQCKPTYNFTCTNPSQALSFLSLQASPITLYPVTTYFQATTPEGIRASTHTQHTVSAGLVVLNTLSVRQGVIAQLTGTVYPVSISGDSAPAAIVDNASLPGLNRQAEVDHLGSVVFNGTTLNYVVGYDINFNTVVDFEPSSGQKFPTYATVISHNPEVTISLLDPRQAVSLVGQTGCKISSTTTLGLNRTSNRIATGTAVETFHIHEGLATLQAVPAQQGSIVTAQIHIDCHWDGSNNPLSLS
jgi:hypothetical protein